MLAKAGKHGFRRRPLAMTSLIDVIFLLLLFFMLTSTFSKYAEVELLSAGAGSPPPSEQTTIFLRLNVDGLSLHGEQATLEGLPEALGTADATTTDKMVLVSLGDAVSSQRLVDLLAVLRGIQGLKIHVLEGKKDAP